MIGVARHAILRCQFLVKLPGRKIGQWLPVHRGLNQRAPGPGFVLEDIVFDAKIAPSSPGARCGRASMATTNRKRYGISSPKPPKRGANAEC